MFFNSNLFYWNNALPFLWVSGTKMNETEAIIDIAKNITTNQTGCQFPKPFVPGIKDNIIVFLIYPIPQTHPTTIHCFLGASPL